MLYNILKCKRRFFVIEAVIFVICFYDNSHNFATVKNSVKRLFNV